MANTVEDIDRMIQELMQKKQQIADAQDPTKTNSFHTTAATATSAGKAASQRLTHAQESSPRDQRKPSKLL